MGHGILISFHYSGAFEIQRDMRRTKLRSTRRQELKKAMDV